MLLSSPQKKWGDSTGTESLILIINTTPVLGEYLT